MEATDQSDCLTGIDDLTWDSGFVPVSNMVRFNGGIMLIGHGCVFVSASINEMTEMLA
jgi:hypothetical protein